MLPCRFSEMQVAANSSQTCRCPSKARTQSLADLLHEPARGASSHHVAVSLQPCWGLNHPPLHPCWHLFTGSGIFQRKRRPWCPGKLVEPLAPPTRFSKAVPRSLSGRTACKAGVCRTLTKATCIFNSAPAYVSQCRQQRQLSCSLVNGRQVGTGSTAQ